MNPLTKVSGQAASGCGLCHCAMVITAAVLLAGCTAGDVAMQDPRNGATATCSGTLRELNPWSQTMACVANYEAEGWIRANPE